jgi:hypothetical protein
MLCRVAIVRADVSKEGIVVIIIIIRATLPSENLGS